MAAPDFYSVAPSCIHHDLPPGIPFSPEIMAPFKDCSGFFTFGPGREWAFGNAVYPIPEGGKVGDVLYSGAFAIYTISAIGIVVMILAFIGWVWFEHRKLMDRADKLRAAGTQPIGGPRSG